LPINAAYERLEMVIASGRSVGWEWDLRGGRGHWFGDLQTMFGIQSASWSGTVEEFFQCVHPEDRKRWRMHGLTISLTRRNSGSFAGMVLSAG